MLLLELEAQRRDSYKCPRCGVVPALHVSVSPLGGRLCATRAQISLCIDQAWHHVSRHHSTYNFMSAKDETWGTETIYSSTVLAQFQTSPCCTMGIPFQSSPHLFGQPFLAPVTFRASCRLRGDNSPAYGVQAPGPPKTYALRRGAVGAAPCYPRYVAVLPCRGLLHISPRLRPFSRGMHCERHAAYIYRGCRSLGGVREADGCNARRVPKVDGQMLSARGHAVFAFHGSARRI